MRGDHRLVDGEVGGERRAFQRHRLEVARLRLLLQRLEIEAGALEQVDRQVALDPAFDRGVLRLRVLADDVEHRVGVGVLDRRPAVGRRVGLVHDQDTGGALARGLLVLVGPAAVVGHGLAAEVAVAGLEVGVVDQHDGDLAVQVDALEVVPVALRRLDAIAAEHERQVRQRNRFRSVQRRAHGDFFALRQVLRLAGYAQREFRRAGNLRAGQRHSLRPSTLAVLQVAARLETGSLHLLDHIGDGLGLARSGRAAALECVGRQRLDLLRQALRIECRRGCRFVRANRGRGKGQCNR